MLSATMKEVFPYLCKVVASFQPINYASQMYRDAICKPDCRVYRNLYRSNTYQLHFYQEPEQLVEHILHSNQEEKWLIFSKSRNKSQKLMHSIQGRGKCIVACMDAGKKDRAVWKNIVQNSYYKERVLITTSVLDNGVSICDDAVKHMVLPFYDYTEFMKMLGRKRIKDGEIVHVYCEVPKVSRLQAELNYVNKKLEVIESIADITYCDAPLAWKYEELTRRLQQMWASPNVVINKLFYIDDMRMLRANGIACVKLIMLREFYQNLIPNKNVPDYYENIIRERLSIAPVTENHENELEKFLADYVDQPIEQTEQEKFYQEFQQRYKQYCR